MWGLTFLAALLTLLMRNTPSTHGKGKHDAAAAEPFLDAPKPFSAAYSVVGRQLLLLLCIMHVLICQETCSMALHVKNPTIGSSIRGPDKMCSRLLAHADEACSALPPAPKRILDMVVRGNGCV